MKNKRSSYIMIATLIVLMIVLHNKLHSASKVQKNNDPAQQETYSSSSAGYFPSSFLRLTE